MMQANSFSLSPSPNHGFRRFNVFSFDPQNITSWKEWSKSGVEVSWDGRWAESWPMQAFIDINHNDVTEAEHILYLHGFQPESASKSDKTAPGSSNSFFRQEEPTLNENGVGAMKQLFTLFLSQSLDINELLRGSGIEVIWNGLYMMTMPMETSFLVKSADAPQVCQILMRMKIKETKKLQ